MTFDEWVKQTVNDTPRYQKLYDSWYKHDNSQLEWEQYYWTLRKCWEDAQNNV